MPLKHQPLRGSLIEAWPLKRFYSPIKEFAFEAPLLAH